MTTLYELLGVTEDATDEAIKRGYRKAAMQAHPDRNVGNEAAARVRFQEIKEAYSILSDPALRRVYDEAYAEESQRLAREQEQEEARARAEREAIYARFVTLAMRFAEQGHNRDVVFGVLLGQECELTLATQISHSVVELHASRQARESAEQRAREAAEQQEAVEMAEAADGGEARQAEPASKATASSKADEHLHPNIFATLWHSMFGLHP